MQSVLLLCLVDTFVIIIIIIVRTSKAPLTGAQRRRTVHVLLLCHIRWYSAFCRKWIWFDLIGVYVEWQSVHFLRLRLGTLDSGSDSNRFERRAECCVSDPLTCSVYYMHVFSSTGCRSLQSQMVNGVVHAVTVMYNRPGVHYWSLWCQVINGNSAPTATYKRRGCDTPFDNYQQV